MYEESFGSCGRSVQGANAPNTNTFNMLDVSVTGVEPIARLVNRGTQNRLRGEDVRRD